MPGDPDVERLVAEAIEHAQRAEHAARQADREYQARRLAVEGLRDAGLSYAAIGQRLGLTRSGVQAILRR